MTNNITHVTNKHGDKIYIQNSPRNSLLLDKDTFRPLLDTHFSSFGSVNAFQATCKPSFLAIPLGLISTWKFARRENGYSRRKISIHVEIEIVPFLKESHHYFMSGDFNIKFLQDCY